jgi:hypothetical protein
MTSNDTEFVDFVDALRMNHRSFITEYLIDDTPSIREVAENTIKYCNAKELSLDGTVYLLKFPSGKYYAGQTLNFKKRMGDYSRNDGSNVHMSRALMKHGFENVIIGELYDVTISACYDGSEPDVAIDLLAASNDDTCGGAGCFNPCKFTEPEITVVIAP